MLTSTTANGQPGHAEFGVEKLGGKAVFLETREYNALNQLTDVYRDGVKTAYRYRPDGLRHSKAVTDRKGSTGSTIHLWDGQNIVAEVNGANNNLKAGYLRGIGLVAEQLNGALTYYLYSAQGDVVRRADSRGNLLLAADYRYDAFGSQMGQNASDSNPFRYRGEYWDEEIQSVYLRARSYVPGNGRFTQRDSYPGEESNPLSLNLYVYCHNNPVIYSDPSGHRTVLESALIGLAIVAIIPVMTYIAFGAGMVFTAVTVGAVTGMLISGVMDVLFQWMQSGSLNNYDPHRTIMAMTLGGTSGALSGLPIGALAQIAGNAVISGSVSYAYGNRGWNLAADVGIGAFVGSLGGAGVGFGDPFLNNRAYSGVSNAVTSGIYKVTMAGLAVDTTWNYMQNPVGLAPTGMGYSPAPSTIAYQQNMQYYSPTSNTYVDARTYHQDVWKTAQNIMHQYITGRPMFGMSKAW